MKSFYLYHEYEKLNNEEVKETLDRDSEIDEILLSMPDDQNALLSQVIAEASFGFTSMALTNGKSEEEAKRYSKFSVINILLNDGIDIEVLQKKFESKNIEPDAELIGLLRGYCRYWGQIIREEPE